MGCASSKQPLSQAAVSGVEAFRKAQPPDQTGVGAGAGPSTPNGTLRPGPGGPVASPAAAAQDSSSSASSSSSSSESHSNSEWDQYSIRGPDSSTCGTRRPRQMLGSPLGGSSLRLRQDSLFGVTARRLLSPVKDTEQLRLCKAGGCTFVNQYLVIKYLGRGSCGRVFLCMNIDDRQLYAVKIVKKVELEAGRASRSGRKRNPLEDLWREIAVMRRMLHPNVVALREVVDDASSSKLLLVMDYMEGGPVMTREGLERGHRIPEPVARLYFRHMAQALDYLHSQRVVHGDLKPENALMSGGLGRVALSDFGCAKVLVSEDEELDRCNGTPAFLAPEMMKPNARFRGCPADVYALGACLYTFVFGRIPFSAPTVMKLFEVVQSTPVGFPEGIPASESLKELLLGMLAKDPAERITLDRVLVHPWVTLDGRFPITPWRQQQQAQQDTQPATADVPAAAAPPVPAAAGEGSAGGQQQGADSPAAAAEAAGAAAAPAAAPSGGPQQGGGTSVAVAAEGTWEYEGDELEREDQLRGMVGPEVEVARFRPGQRLFRQGERGSHLLYILEGECEVRYTPTHYQTPTVTPSSTPASTPAPTPSRSSLASAANSASASPAVAGWAPGQGSAAGPAALAPPLPSTPARSPFASPPPPPAPGAEPSTPASAASSAGPQQQQQAQQQGGGQPSNSASTMPLVPPASPSQQAPSGRPPLPGGGSSGRGPPGVPHRRSLSFAGETEAVTEPGPGPRAASASLAGRPQQEPQRRHSTPAAAEAAAPSVHGQAAAAAGACDSPEPASEQSFAVGPAAPGRGGLEACFSGLSVASMATNSTLAVMNDTGASGSVQLVSFEDSTAEGQGFLAAVSAEPSGEAAAAPTAAGPTATAAAAGGEGQEEFSFAAAGSRPVPQLRVAVPSDDAEAVTPSFISPGPAPAPFAAGRPSAHACPPASTAPAAAATAPDLPSPTRASPAAALSGVAPASPAAAPPAAPGEQGGSMLSPGPHLRHLSADIDNAYSSVATPEKVPGEEEGGDSQELPPSLVEAATQAQELVAELRRGGEGGTEFLVGVRGPGQVLGEMEALGGSGARRAASVVALTPLRAAVVPYAAAKEYLSKNPLAKQQLAELMWVRQSENIVLEALVRLAAVGEGLQQQQQQQQDGGTGGTGGAPASPPQTISTTTF